MNHSLYQNRMTPGTIYNIQLTRRHATLCTKADRMNLMDLIRVQGLTHTTRATATEAARVLSRSPAVVKVVLFQSEVKMLYEFKSGVII